MKLKNILFFIGIITITLSSFLNFSSHLTFRNEDHWESTYTVFDNGYQNPIWYLWLIVGLILVRVLRSEGVKTFLVFLFLLSSVSIWLTLASSVTRGATPFIPQFEIGIWIELSGVTILLISTFLYRANPRK